MGTETILAIIAACAIIAAAMMFAMAYRMNEKWVRHCRKMTDLFNDQNGAMKEMNREWYEIYMKMVELKAEAKHE
jgi:hypothetical protein